MIINLAAVARVAPLTVLILAACVLQRASEQRRQELQQAHAQSATQQAEIIGGPGA